MLLRDSVKILSVCIFTLYAAKAENIENKNKLEKTQTDAEEAVGKNISFNIIEAQQDVATTPQPIIDSRVNGGHSVNTTVPFQVSLQIYRRNSWRHYCGGSIISADHILTAAHCVDKIKVEDISVVAGTLTWNSGGQRHRAAATRIHPEYSLSPRIINDIAVLKVRPAFNLRHISIGTINLGSNSRIGDSVQVRLTGWGATTPTVVGGLPTQLQQLDYKTISNAECRRRGFKVTRNEICALSSKGQGSCMGDSGGPLVTTEGSLQLVGVVSYGSATCAQGRPDVYSRVSSFLAYITEVITNEIP